MKKKLFVFSILICALVSFIPCKSYGICNTFSFTKKLNAVQLTLSDGTVLHDLNFKQDIATKSKKSLKKLDLAFVLNCNSLPGELEGVKKVVNDIIDKVFESYEDIYGNDAKDYIRISVRLYDGTEPNKYEERRNIIGSLTNKDEIKNEINNKVSSGENNVHVSTALEKTGEEFFGRSMLDESIMKLLVFITNGNMNVTDEGKGIVKSALNDFTGKYMAGIYNINVHSGDKNKVSLSDFSFAGIQQLEGTIDFVAANAPDRVKEFIEQDASTIGDLDPQNMKYQEVQILPNCVQIICDDVILQGATLKAEYELRVGARAIYGNGLIYASSITDYLDPKFHYSKKETLLTNPSETNEDYGWEQEEITDAEGVKKDAVVAYGCAGRTMKLVLTSVISSNMKDLEYKNDAQGYMKYSIGIDENGEEQTAERTTTASAPKIRVVPPTGNNKIFNYSVIIVIISAITIALLIVLKRVKNR